MRAPIEQDSGPPTDGQSSKPSDISGGSRLVLETFTKDVGEIKSDVKEINRNRHDDFVKLLFVYGSGFVLLAGMIVASYLMLSSKISTINDLNIKVDTKLEELIKRIPPVQAPPPRR